MSGFNDYRGSQHSVVCGVGEESEGVDGLGGKGEGGTVWTAR